MASDLQRIKVFLVRFGIMIMAAFLVSSCSALQKKDKATAPSSEKKTDKQAVALYYDFGDVLVPKELKVDKNASFIYRTAGFSAGVLVLKGRIESASLIDFFENNMVKDNWKIISSFKSERTMMLFQKENRWCVISIKDETFNTRVEIWVAPTINQTKAGLIK
jgi:hypothetical protein